MEFDPHTLQQLVQRIHQQVRCPQCGKRVPIDLSAVRVVSDEFLLLQLKCETCNAYIVLHASLKGLQDMTEQEREEFLKLNASSVCCFSEKEREELSSALEKADGSFEKLFHQKKLGNGGKAVV